MKTRHLLIVISSAIIIGCNSLNDVPLENMPPEVAFQDSIRVEYFVNELYPYLYAGVSYNRIGSGGTGGSMFDCVTDLAVYSPVGNCADVNKYTQATLNYAPGGTPDARWAECYQAIRKANVVLKYMGNVKKISQSHYDRLRGEALLHKALAHFEVFKRYGGIPIMDDLLDLTGDINIPRSTYEETVNYIVSLCDEAAELLPVRYPANDYGRLTRGSAYGLKSKILLYAASPLYNENPLEGSSDLQHYAEPSKERWNDAAQAALQVINLKTDGGAPAYELYPDCQRYFFTREGNYESLIMKQQALSNSVEKADGPSGYQNCRGNTNATLELVNMYETLNGLLPEDDPEYDPQKPYLNRDKRFYAHIIYNGTQLWGRPVETFVGGADYPANATSKGCVTGYVMFKHVDPQATTVSPIVYTYHDWPILRYAEILLNYAEAMNEYMGESDADAVLDEMIYTCVNTVRKRAGLPEVSDLTRGEMRELIHRERTVELAFEDSRWYDLKRWRESETVLNRPVHGVKIIKDGDNFTYDYGPDGKGYEIEQRKFDARMYYYPIPQTEMNKNTALKQNYLW